MHYRNNPTISEFGFFQMYPYFQFNYKHMAHCTAEFNLNKFVHNYIQRYSANDRMTYYH